MNQQTSTLYLLLHSIDCTQVSSIYVYACEGHIKCLKYDPNSTRYSPKQSGKQENSLLDFLAFRANFSLLFCFSFFSLSLSLCCSQNARQINTAGIGCRSATAAAAARLRLSVPLVRISVVRVRISVWTPRPRLLLAVRNKN